MADNRGWTLARENLGGRIGRWFVAEPHVKEMGGFEIVEVIPAARADHHKELRDDLLRHLEECGGEIIEQLEGLVDAALEYVAEVEAERGKLRAEQREAVAIDIEAVPLPAPKCRCLEGVPNSVDNCPLHRRVGGS